MKTINCNYKNWETFFQDLSRFSSQTDADSLTEQDVKLLSDLLYKYETNHCTEKCDVVKMCIQVDKDNQSCLGETCESVRKARLLVQKKYGWYPKLTNLNNFVYCLSTKAK